MNEEDARLARLKIIRQVAKKRQASGAHERTLERLRQQGLGFIAYPRVAASATFDEKKGREKRNELEVEEEENLFSEVGDGSLKQDKDDIDDVILEYGVKAQTRTTPGQKLEALWKTRKTLNLKPGEEVEITKLAKPAAVELQISLTAMRTFMNEVMTPAQRIALKKGLRANEKPPPK